MRTRVRSALALPAAPARRLVAALGAAAAVSLMLTAPSSAATSPNTVNLGAVALDPNGFDCNEGFPDRFQQSDGRGESFGPQAAGVLKSWTTMTRTEPGLGVALKVWRPVADQPGAYRVVFTSPYVSADAVGAKTFTMPDPFPVLPGDRWGLSSQVISGSDYPTGLYNCLVGDSSGDNYYGALYFRYGDDYFDPSVYNTGVSGSALNLYATVTYDDVTAPAITFDGGVVDGASYTSSSLPAAPTCSATDTESGVDATGCVVTGYSTGVGTHVLTATATDRAGNSATSTRTYKVTASWTVSGFTAPVNMGGVVNTVKGGSTVPVKFSAQDGSGAAVTDATKVGSFSAAKVSCSGSAASDPVEITTTGATSLRYDATAGRFVYNWQTPKAAGSCYQLTLTTADGTKTNALFQLK